MKVVFLDFDGPIIPMASHQPPYRIPGSGAQALPCCVDQLNKITDATGAVIVVSSTWRADGLMKTRERLHKWGIKADCIAITPHMDERDPKSGLWISHPRGQEIQKWLDEYDREEVEAFVILDDDSDMEHLMPYLVQTPFETGITEDHTAQAVALLNR